MKERRTCGRKCRVSARQWDDHDQGLNHRCPFFKTLFLLPIPAFWRTTIKALITAALFQGPFLLPISAFWRTTIKALITAAPFSRPFLVPIPAFLKTTIKAFITAAPFSRPFFVLNPGFDFPHRTKSIGLGRTQNQLANGRKKMLIFQEVPLE